MRRLTYMFVIAGLAILCASSAWAGRLNFMLINLTGHDIVDAKICPTYFPKYESQNLLKDALDSHSRVYIGPNYYGEQKFWNIALKWANGYEHTFTKLRLTRYNTYTVYSTPEGVKIRQTYEPAFARYEFGPEAPSYMGEEPDVAVRVSGPEKIDTTVKTAVVEPGKAAQPAPRNLSFADDTAPNTLAMKTTVELTRNDKTNTVLPTEDFKAGDKIRLLFSTNKDGHIYWVSRDSAGQYQVLFPSAKTGVDNTVVRNKEYAVPTVDPLQFDENKGTETLMAILSPNTVPDLDKAIKLQADGKDAEASKLVSDVVNGHEQKRTVSGMIFEEEDDEDVNTQSQLADGEEVFVGTYELSHE